MRRIVLATDLSDRAERAQRMALLLAREHHYGLKLVYAIDTDQPTAMIDAQRDTANFMLQRLATTIETVDGVACSVAVVSGRGPDEAIRSAVDDTTPLIVLGSHRKRQLRDLFLGGTSERIIAHTDCPVLVVRAAPVERYRRLLLATDLSEGSMARARALGATPVSAGTSTTVVHLVGTQEQSAVPTGRMTDDARDRLLAHDQAVARERLEGFVRNADLGAVGIRVEADTRPTATALMDIAAHEGADLIVLTPRQGEGLDHFLRYRTTTRLLNASPVDLLIL